MFSWPPAASPKRGPGSLGGLSSGVAALAWPWVCLQGPPEAPSPINYRNALERSSPTSAQLPGEDALHWSLKPPVLWFPMERLSSARAFGTRAGLCEQGWELELGLVQADIIHRVMVPCFHTLFPPALPPAFLAYLLPLSCTLPSLQPRICSAPWGCTTGWCLVVGISRDGAAGGNVEGKGLGLLGASHTEPR